MVAPQMSMTATEVLNPFGEFANATIHVVDYETADASRPAAMEKLSTPVTDELTAELDGAARWLGVASDEILLAALARTIARTLGDGVVPVDIASQGRCLLNSVPLVCATARQATATEVLGGVQRGLAAAGHSTHGLSEVYFTYIGAVAAEMVPALEAPPGLGHALELRVYRIGDLVHLDWWFDASRFERYTVEELTEQFPLALYEMTSDALPPL